LTFKIRLKTGFFKTQPYYLTIGQGQIILTPQEDMEKGRLIISEADLQSVCITRQQLSAGELEIITRSGACVGIFSDETDLEEVSSVFSREFGPKLIFQQGLH
jgi:hypothetical protein